MKLYFLRIEVVLLSQELQMFDQFCVWKCNKKEAGKKREIEKKEAGKKRETDKKEAGKKREIEKKEAGKKRETDKKEARMKREWESVKVFAPINNQSNVVRKRSKRPMNEKERNGMYPNIEIYTSIYLQIYMSKTTHLYMCVCIIFMRHLARGQCNDLLVM